MRNGVAFLLQVQEGMGRIFADNSSSVRFRVAAEKTFRKRREKEISNKKEGKKKTKESRIKAEIHKELKKEEVQGKFKHKSRYSKDTGGPISLEECR
ncbi:hypothetical protein K1719_029084 [Acacia pycnantha]|nr:hypothetical protein K1719_029084 [Acacia pycnantha]